MKNGILNLAIAATFATAGAASAATITNGSFEEPGTLNANWQTMSAGNTGLTGWTIGGSGIDLINQYWEHSDESYSVDMSAGNAGTLSQTVTGLVIGQTYKISFDMAGNSAGGNVVKSLSAMIGGSGGTFTFDTNGQNRFDMGWETQTFTFVAQSTSSLLEFASLDQNAYGAALDNVAISAVPLPAGGLLLLGGLGGIAAFRRKRKA